MDIKDIDIGRQYQLRKRMTDRQRREKLDEIFRTFFPGESAEEIRRLREEYVARNHHKRKSYLPQPEKKPSIGKGTLWLEEIARELTEKHTKDMEKYGWGKAILAMLMFCLAIAWFLAAVAILLAGAPILKVLILVPPVAFGAIHWYRKKTAGNKLYPILMAGGLTSQDWTVADMEWEYVSDPDGDYYTHALILTRGKGQQMRYSVTGEEYARVREGDRVHLLSFDQKLLGDVLKGYDFKKPVYLVAEDCWRMDEPLQRLLGILEQGTVPLVQTPLVQTPLVQTPPVQTPPVQIPPVQIPPVQTPPEETEYGANDFIKWLVLLFLVLLVVVQCLVDRVERGSREELYREKETTAATTRPPIPEEEIMVIPDPEHFFGVEELVFDEFPKDALTAYYKVMMEDYGFELDRPFESSAEQELNAAQFNKLICGDEEKYYVWITPMVRKDGQIAISFMFRDYLREEPRETWAGDITPYLHNPDNWEDCGTCGGTGDCRECWGGWVDVGGGDDKMEVRCRDCDGKGNCKDCYDGKIRKNAKDKAWDRMTDAEKREADWKRYTKELFKQP